MWYLVRCLQQQIGSYPVCWVDLTLKVTDLLVAAFSSSTPISTVGAVAPLSKVELEVLDLPDGLPGDSSGLLPVGKASMVSKEYCVDGALLVVDTLRGKRTQCCAIKV